MLQKGEDQTLKGKGIVEALDEKLWQTETELAATYKILGRHEDLAKLLEQTRGRLLESRKTYQQGLVDGRKCFPGGNSAALGSSKCGSVDVTVVQETWRVLDVACNFERFLLQHSDRLESFKSTIMQCCEHPEDLPAYKAFGEFLSDVAGIIGELLGGANLAAHPSFIVPPHSFLERSCTSDDDLIPDLLWSPAPGIKSDTVENNRFIQAELKSFETANQVRAQKFKQAIGEVLKVGCLLHGRLYEKFSVTNDYEVPGIASDGVHVVVSFTLHSFAHKPKRCQTPILELVRSAGILAVSSEQVENFTRVANEHARLHNVYAEGAGFKEVVFAVFRVMQAEAMKAASQEEEDLTWFKGQVLQLEAVDSYEIGNQISHVQHSLGWWKQWMKEMGCPRGAQFRVIVKRIIKETLLSIVLHVQLENQDWYLKLGPPYRQRLVALTFGADWERWLQVERDMFFRDKLCSYMSTCSFPVAVSGCSRPAFLMAYAGESVDRQCIGSQEVFDMSKELYMLVQHAAYHNVRHGDICPSNICHLNGVYSLIDWGLATGSGFLLFVNLIDKAFPIAGGMFVGNKVDLELSSDIDLDHRMCQGNWDLDSALFCCLKLLNGKLPWSEAAATEDLTTVLQLREETKTKMKMDPWYLNQHKVYQPLVDSWLKGSKAADSRCTPKFPCYDVECPNPDQ